MHVRQLRLFAMVVHLTACARSAARAHVDAGPLLDPTPQLLAAAETLGSSLEEIADSVEMRTMPPSSQPRSAPLAGNFEISSAFGIRRDPFLDQLRPHRGIDLAAARGTPVRATAPGLVFAAGARSGYGILVEIDHGGGYETRYAHLGRTRVATGQWVSQGQVIGYVGSTGRSTGPHLHYEVLRDRRRVDPDRFLEGQARLPRAQ